MDVKERVEKQRNAESWRRKRKEEKKRADIYSSVCFSFSDSRLPHSFEVFFLAISLYFQVYATSAESGRNNLKGESKVMLLGSNLNGGFEYVSNTVTFGIFYVVFIYL